MCSSSLLCTDVVVSRRNESIDGSGGGGGSDRGGSEMGRLAKNTVNSKPQYLPAAPLKRTSASDIPVVQLITIIFRATLMDAPESRWTERSEMAEIMPTSFRPVVNVSTMIAKKYTCACA